MLRYAIIATTAFVAAYALADGVSPLGKWNGKMIIKMPTFPPSVPLAQRRKINGMLEEMKKGEFLLTVLPGGKYTLRESGMASFPTSTSKGTWKQSGDTLTLQGSAATSRPLVFKIVKNGKRMACALPADKGSMIFTRP